MQLYRALSDQLLAARDLLLTVGQRNATERLGALLLALSRRNERIGADPTRIALPMTRADIADFLSLTIETVSRTFTKLRQGGIIDLVQSTLVVIRDQKALERLAAGEVAGAEMIDAATAEAHGRVRSVQLLSLRDHRCAGLGIDEMADELKRYWFVAAVFREPHDLVSTIAAVARKRHRGQAFAHRRQSSSRGRAQGGGWLGRGPGASGRRARGR